MAYFKMVGTNVPVTLANGSVVKFQSVAFDEAVYPPENVGISDQRIGLLRECAARGVGGITEISAEQYLGLLEQKKNNPAGLRPPWREELSLQMNLEKQLQGPPTQPIDLRKLALPIVPGDAAPVATGKTAAAEPEGPVSAPRPTASKR